MATVGTGGHRGLTASPGALALVLAATLVGQQGRTEGSRWLLVLAVGVGVGLVLDGLWAFVALGRVDARVHAADGVVGRRGPVEVEVVRPSARVTVRMSSLAQGDHVVLDAPGVVTLDVVPDVRGVFPQAEIELAVRGPLALVGFRRRVLVRLAEPAHVAPPLVVGEPFEPPAAARSRAADVALPRPSSTGDLTRGVRPWEPGDGRRRVHWPATARSGVVMARDLEELAGDDVLVVVDLGPDPGPAAERVAGLARWAVEQLLDEGRRVAMLTREPTGLVLAAVADHRAGRRRLAAAVTGAPVADAVPVAARDAQVRAGPPPAPDADPDDPVIAWGHHTGRPPRDRP